MFPRCCFSFPLIIHTTDVVQETCIPMVSRLQPILGPFKGVFKISLFSCNCTEGTFQPTRNHRFAGALIYRPSPQCTAMPRSSLSSDSAQLSVKASYYSIQLYHVASLQHAPFDARRHRRTARSVEMCVTLIDINQSSPSITSRRAGSSLTYLTECLCDDDEVLAAQVLYRLPPTTSVFNKSSIASARFKFINEQPVLPSRAPS